MTKIVILLVSLLLVLPLLGQGKIANSGAMNTCTGAINLFKNGEFQLQFTGKKSSNELSTYPSLSDFETENVIWLSFIAPTQGEVTFNASVKTGHVDMIVFQEEKQDICEEINNGVAEIKRIYKGKNQSTVGLDYEIGGGVLYALELREGQQINIVLSTVADVKEMLSFNWEFVPKVVEKNEPIIVDQRNDDFAPTFSVLVRDKYSKVPLNANLSIEGSRSFDALYMGTDFFFSIDRNCKLTIKCDVEGYFFVDIVDTTVYATEDMEIIIPMEPVGAGKHMVIEDIEFNAGSTEFTPASEPRLRRLKDFLALNSELNIEIQGHVFALGPNSLAGQKISEARAKRVMKYLVDNGIDKSRLKAVGYGNTQPIYAQPKFSYEEQANRRVEILIL